MALAETLPQLLHAMASIATSTQSTGQQRYSVSLLHVVSAVVMLLAATAWAALPHTASVTVVDQLCL